MALIDDLEARFVEAVNHSLVKLDFDRWPQAVYFQPRSAMQNKQKAAYSKCFRGETDADIALDICILRCRDENGKRLFYQKDREKLSSVVASDDFEDIAKEMTKLDEELTPGK